MRINHNIASMTTQASLFRVNRDMNTSLERLSTGLRINSAADDAAGLGVSENLRAQVNGTAQANRNAQDGIAAITIAEGAANEVSDILQRMRELAVQSSNDTLTSTERAYTDQEYQSLSKEIDRISNVTNYNGMKLISSGTASTTTNDRFGIGGTAGGKGSTLWIDANHTYGVDSITITIDTLTTSQLGSGAGSGGVASLNVTTLTSQADAVNAIQNLDESINSVNTMRSNMGAYINRLNDAINNLQVSNTNQQSAESLIRDVDFAKETASFTREQILTQSGTSMLAQANKSPQSVLQLLQG